MLQNADYQQVNMSNKGHWALNRKRFRLMPFFHFCEKFDALIDMGISKDVEAEAFNLLAEISDVLIKPRKEQIENWQPPDSGP